jgi:uncharacterized membrane protein YagU involved in acid resistance
MYAFLGGLIAGTLDIVYAIVFFGFRGVPTVSILQSIASGLLGSRAYEGGVATAVLGLLLHFVLMLLIAMIFFIAARRLPSLIRHPVTVGAAYGIAVYWVMNLIVLPLSAYPGTFEFHPIIVPAGLLVHAFLIGVPIAMATRAGLTK